MNISNVGKSKRKSVSKAMFVRGGRYVKVSSVLFDIIEVTDLGVEVNSKMFEGPNGNFIPSSRF